MSSLVPEQPLLPPEVLLDPDNPANDRYNQRLDSLRRAAVARSRTMRARYVRVAREIHSGQTVAQIAERLGIGVGAVYRIRQRPDVLDLVDILRHTASLIEGPNLALRKHMLWRIARRAEEGEPGVSITALKELNKLEGAYPVQALPQNNQVNITINADTMPRTTLDGEPG